jgi:hypothetical protein
VVATTAKGRAGRRRTCAGTEKRRNMKISRTLVTLSITLAALGAAAAVAAAASSDSTAARSGGALAQPPVEQRGGGNVAPASPRGDANASAAAEAPAGGAAAPPAEAAQDEQPTTPGGEEQNGGEQPPDEPAETVEEPGTDDVGGAVGDTGSATSGLPSTGLELSAMAVIGLGLLLLGAALRPGRSGTAGRR